VGRPISTEYTAARKILTGVNDPSGLKLVFELDGNRVLCHVEADEALCGKSKVLPAGQTQAVVDDLAHATVAALKKRIGMTRESRIRFLKPLYADQRFRADGTIFRDTGDIVVVQCRLMNKKEQLCVEAETEFFSLTAEQVRKMTPDGMVPLELRKYLSS
jgi:acyl-CoA thioesterase FadM